MEEAGDGVRPDQVEQEAADKEASPMEVSSSFFER